MLSPQNGAHRPEYKQLSGLAIAGTSMAFAVCGLVAYAYVVLGPVSPVERIAWGHADVSEPIAR
jgi:hypothetical protein